MFHNANIRPFFLFIELFIYKIERTFEMRKTISSLSEQQLSNIIATTVSDVLSEMAYTASFNLDEFNRITTFNSRKAYCE